MLLGNRVKAARKRKAYSQQTLGDLLGVSKVSVCGYEKGTRTPTLETFEDLLKFLDLTPDEALGRDYSAISEKGEPYGVKISKEDMEILKEFRARPALYHQISEDPKRVIELISRKLKK